MYEIQQTMKRGGINVDIDEVIDYQNQIMQSLRYEIRSLSSVEDRGSTANLHIWD